MSLSLCLDLLLDLLLEYQRFVNCNVNETLAF